MTVFCVAIFSMSVFAENEAIKPHRLECPNCGRFSVVSVKNHTRTANNRQEPCDHYTQGTDEVMDIIAYYQDICGSCVYNPQNIALIQARMLEFVTAGMGEPWLCI